MDYRSESVTSFGLQPSLEIFNRGFSDYTIPIHLDRAAWARMFRQDGIDPLESLILFDGQDPIGLGLIAHRGWTVRLAAMAVVPEARGSGAGRSLLDLLMKQGRERGERSMVLEVIESNRPARTLYESSGFSPVRRLFSYSAGSLPHAAAPLAEVDPHLVARHVSAYARPDLPWQLSGESLAQFGKPACAFQAEQAFALVTNIEADQILLRALIVLPEVRGLGQAGRLLGALAARFPGKGWIVPALCPEEFDGWLLSHGFERGELTQLQMAVAL